jgi:hypothetical protein
MLLSSRLIVALRAVQASSRWPRCGTPEMAAECVALAGGDALSRRKRIPLRWNDVCLETPLRSSRYLHFPDPIGIDFVSSVHRSM